MTDNFKEIGSLFGREGAGAGFAKQTDKESFTYAFAWPEGDTWATLTGYLNLDEQPEEYVRRVLQDGGFRSDWDNPDYDPIGDFKETAGDEYRIPLLKVLLREQLESRYEVANHFSTMNRARVELSAFIQNEGGAPLPEDALGTPEEHGIRAMLIATGEPPREVTLLPDKNGSISDLADKVANGTVVKGHRLGFVGVDRKPLPNGDKWKPVVTDAKRENMQVGRVSSPLYGKQSVKTRKVAGMARNNLRIRERRFQTGNGAHHRHPTGWRNLPPQANRGN